MIKRKTKLMQIDGLVVAYRKLNKLEKLLKPIFDPRPECNLYNDLWASFQVHLRAVKLVIGDKYDWLDWYIYDNDCGHKDLYAVVDGKEVEVKTPEQLLDIIEEGD